MNQKRNQKEDVQRKRVENNFNIHILKLFIN